MPVVTKETSNQPLERPASLNDAAYREIKNLLLSGQLSLDLPSAPANSAPRGGRVQAAAGAPHRGGGAKRSAWTRLSTALPFDADGGRS